MAGKVAASLQNATLNKFPKSIAIELLPVDLVIGGGGGLLQDIFSRDILMGKLDAVLKARKSGHTRVSNRYNLLLLLLLLLLLMSCIFLSLASRT